MYTGARFAISNVTDVTANVTPAITTVTGYIRILKLV